LPTVWYLPRSSGYRPPNQPPKSTEIGSADLRWDVAVPNEHFPTTTGFHFAGKNALSKTSVAG
jgi:hypothetical protein